MKAVKYNLAKRGRSPRVYCDVVVFLAAESRQLDNLKETMRGALAWDGIVNGCHYNNPDTALGVNGEEDTGIDNAIYLHFKDNYRSSLPFNLQPVKKK